MAAHDHAPRVIAEAAYEVAFLAVMDSLACAFKALHDPACAKLLGALVPGATMAFGARVPGTSYQLDPVQAAFNIGTTVSWLQANDPALTTVAGDVSDNLGAILAVADYRARQAIAEAASPPTVRDLFGALIHARELASLEWARSVHEHAAVSTNKGTESIASAAARCALTRIASAATAASLLGGTRDQVAAAVLIARSEPCVTEHPGTAPVGGWHEPWRIGDATSRGLRLALIALAGPIAPRLPALPSDKGTWQLAVTAELDQTWRDVAARPDIANRIRDRFAACVAAYFPTAQASKLGAMFADRAKLEAVPVNELVSMTVRN
ncbi:MAG: MmgE/PrpD family protein [Steroidobacteraceae bacterium]